MREYLQDKKVLLIGGLGLIGLSTLEKFLKEKSEVLCVDIKRKSRIYNYLFKYKKFKYLRLDVSKHKDIKILIKNLESKFGTPDIFINCSYPRDKNFSKSDFKSLNFKNYSNHIDMHLNSYVWISKLIAEMMRKNKIKGSILNLSSIYGLIAQDMSLYDKTSIKENASYAVIKSGIIGATKLIASTFGKYGIRANCICPSGVERKDIYSKNIKNKKFRQNFIKRVPLKRFATSNDVANAIIFLSSDKASYITGISLPIDGGWTAI